MNRDRTIRPRGRWPGPVILRSGWSKARVRPYNDDLPEAAMRLERGSSDFLAVCARWLFERGVPAVRSGPLDSSSRRPWERAGFHRHRELALLERSLDRPAPAGPVLVREGREEEWGIAAGIDAAAFDVEWRIGRSGMAEASSATPVSRFLIAEIDGSPTGFAIVGTTVQVAYLQRLAVAPASRGLGVGAALTRASITWARARGARTMLLNTQPDNEAAIALYRSQGFHVLPERLSILRLAAGSNRTDRDRPDGT